MTRTLPSSKTAADAMADRCLTFSLSSKPPAPKAAKQEAAPLSEPCLFSAKVTATGLFQRACHEAGITWEDGLAQAIDTWSMLHG